MEKTKFDYWFKILLIGNSKSGKSQIMSRLASNSFNGMHTPTIGIDFSAKTYEIDHKVSRCQIWDCPGQERFRSLLPSYY